jgi:hypothetical protein
MMEEAFHNYPSMEIHHAASRQLAEATYQWNATGIFMLCLCVIVPGNIYKIIELQFFIFFIYFFTPPHPPPIKKNFHSPAYDLTP